MIDIPNAIIERLEAGHELVAVGSFTLDVAAAHDKLENYRVADPHTFVLFLVEAAHLFAGCRAIEFKISATRTTVWLNEVVLDEHELHALLAAANASVTGLEPQAAARMQARQLLGLALITARQLPDTTIELGSSGADSRAVITGKGAPRFTPRGRARASNATWLTIRGPMTMAGERRRFVAAHRRELLRTRCRYATVPLILDAASVSGGPSLAEVEHPYVVREANGRAIARIGRSPARAQATLLLVANGVLLETITDHELGAHLLALVDASDLPRDLGMTQFLRQEAYEQRILAVRQAAASLPPDRWSPAVYLDGCSVPGDPSKYPGAVQGNMMLHGGVVAVVVEVAAWLVVYVYIWILVITLPNIPGTRRHRRLHFATLGRPAIATVERSVEIIEFGSGKRQMLELLVHAPGERPYATELSLRLGQGPPLQAGDRFHVCVDPDDPNRLAPAAESAGDKELSMGVEEAVNPAIAREAIMPADSEASAEAFVEPAAPALAPVGRRLPSSPSPN